MINLTTEERRMAIASMGPEIPRAPILADQFNVTDSTIWSDLRSLRRRGHNLSVIRSNKILTREEKQELRRDYGEGMPMHEMVRKYVVDSTKIRNIASGILRPRVTPAPEGMPSYTTHGEGFISTTYAATEERAKQFQEALHGGRG